MARAEKFGAFGGVFVPSILTILGVIMYLRLPWVVGQAGLWMTVGIIVVAHVISVTTGLSVSSIATDKKVKAGGNYYIISRSLGLPIGGTLGIALFVGLSFSVSLYIIGFVESFLPTLGIEATKDAIRLYGTLAVLAISGIVLVSTSLAIKMQYFILAAILLSLASIFFGEPGVKSAGPVLAPLPNGASLMVLFGIFFPAVTGFTAGVQMSGDLEDPKSSIPIGTMAAIGVGFLIYIALAVFLAFRADAAALVGNTTLLQDIAWAPELVLAGIWGATLSSAMGSLLGAPRILQATSIDRITPRIFAKGYGASSEPRNALLMTFLIAEAGILIGELNVIAAIISIFFITTYGFINLSCAIENWASADFRPSFAIPTWVSVLGASACFLVMIQLDLLAFAGSTLIMGLLYLYLKKRELNLESGDTWEGVWSSVIRSGLHYLSQTVTHSRNWRPNIILFSGGTGARPHLIEFGKWIVHKRGLLSNFDLRESSDNKVLFPKGEQTQYDDDETLQGVFSRRLECSDIYESMETVAQVFGFAGVEPNAVMMGWARNSRDPVKFAQLIGYLSALDYNILMLDYDAERGFGEMRRIDIWWRGGSNNATLALTVLKYLKASEEWQRAEARILILLDNSAQVNRAHRNVAQILEDQRLEAEIKVINNAIDAHPFTEVIRRESAEADLVILGMAPFSNAEAADYVGKINTLVGDIGSTLLLHASSFFETLYIGVEMQMPPRQEDTQTEVSLLPRARPTLPAIAGEQAETHERLTHILAQFYEGGNRSLERYAEEALRAMNQIGSAFVDDLVGLVERNLGALEKSLLQGINPRFRRTFSRIQSDSLYHLHRHFESFSHEQIQAQREHWESGLEQLATDRSAALGAIAKTVNVFHEVADIAPQQGDSAYLRALKFFKRMRHQAFKKPIVVSAPLAKMAAYHLKIHMQRAIYTQQEKLGIESYKHIVSLQKWLHDYDDALRTLARKVQDKSLAAEDITAERKSLIDRLQDLSQSYKETLHILAADLVAANYEGMETICTEIARIDIARRARQNFSCGDESNTHWEKISAVPTMWADNLTAMVNYALIELNMMVFKHRISIVFQRLVDDMQIKIDSGVLDQLDKLEERLQATAKEGEEGGELSFSATLNFDDEIDIEQLVAELMRGVQASIADMPETIEIIAEDSFQQIEMLQYAYVEMISIDLHRLTEYLIESELVEPLQKQLAQLPHHVQRSARTAGDIARLVRFRIENTDAQQEEADLDDGQESLDRVLGDSLQRLEEEREQTQKALATLTHSARELIATTYEKLNPYLMTRLAGNIGQHIRAQESRKVIFGIEIGRRRVRHFFHSALVRLLYHRSEGVLLARRLNDRAADENTYLDTSLGLVESVSARPQVLSSLPLYYRQLFTGKQAIGKEYWVGRNRELKKAEKVVRRHRQGYAGALLVVGEPDAGKTTLCRRIVSTHFNQRQIYHLFAPESGSIDPNLFRTRLAEALGARGDYSELFAALPRDSALVIHDLELWWERSSEGYAVVDEILSLIDRFADRCFFVVNTNVHAFRFLRKLSPLTNAFLDIIDCEPFDAEELQQAILLRHHSTGFKFAVGGRSEESISDFALARMFTRFFDFSAGNIGYALRAWIASIDQFTNEQFALNPPARPTAHSFDFLGDEERVWLQQFVLHKYLTPKRLGRLFGEEENTVRKKLKELCRSGLVGELQPEIFEINPDLKPFIIQQLSERDSA
jgi:amino acid transporter